MLQTVFGPRVSKHLAGGEYYCPRFVAGEIETAAVKGKIAGSQEEVLEPPWGGPTPSSTLCFHRQGRTCTEKVFAATVRERAGLFLPALRDLELCSVCLSPSSARGESKPPSLLGSVQPERASVWAGAGTRWQDGREEKTRRGWLAPPPLPPSAPLP